MARPGAPWYWKAKQRWAATIRGKQVLAPRTIEKDDRIAALAWYAATAAAAHVEQVASSVLTVGDGLEAYLRWCEERVGSGDLTADAFRVTLATTRYAARVPVDGRPFHTLPAAEVGEKQLDAVIANWMAGRKVQKAPPGRRHMLLVRQRIQATFRWMAKEGIVPAYALGDHARIPPPPVETEICSRKHAADWLRWLRKNAKGEADTQFLLLQRILIRTGARPSEIHRATWSDVAWAAGVTPAGATMGVITREEWKSSRKVGRPRKVLLPPVVLKPLRRRYEATRPAPEDLIFRDAKGNPWKAYALSRDVRLARQAAVKAGVPIPAEGPGRIRPYQWRHMAASRLIADGVDLPTTARLLGTSVAMLTASYVHSDAERLAAAAAMLAGPRQVTRPAGGAASEAAASGRPAARRPGASKPRRPRALAPRPRRPRA